MPKPQAEQKDASPIPPIPNTIVVVLLLLPKVAAMEVLPPPLSDKCFFGLGALGAQSTQQKHKKSYGIDAVIMPWLIAGARYARSSFGSTKHLSEQFL